MSLLNWLQTTAVANWVSGSLWAYPIILTFHAFGMALLVGLAIAINLRLAGVAANSIPIAAMDKIMPVALVGAFMNVISGILLFIPDSVRFIHNIAFIIKLGCIIVATLLLVYAVIPQMRALGSLPEDAPIPMKARVLGVVSIIIWLGSIVSGRLMAYVVN